MNENVAIIAGSGSLPEEVYREMTARSRQPLLIGIDGEINEAFSRHADTVLTFGQIGSLFEILAKREIKQVIFAGGISKRPDFKRLKLDLTTVRELPSLLKIAMGGDNTVLEKIATYFEKRDLSVVGVHEVLPELLAGEGMIAGKVDTKLFAVSIENAIKAAKTIGALDAGQAVVCEDGRIIALEGAEGTDAMIERVHELRSRGKISASPKASVLAKVMKPRQDMRADLPSIGPATIDNCREAGIKGIVLEAGRSLILQRYETIAAAKEARIFIRGMKYTGETS